MDMERRTVIFIILATVIFSLLVFLGLRFTGFVPLNVGDSSPCSVDFNEDGIVNVLDFDILRSNFGVVGNSEDYNLWKLGDANMDGVIDLPDFNLLKTNYGQSAFNCLNFCSTVKSCTINKSDGCCPNWCTNLEDVDCVYDGRLMDSIWTNDSGILAGGVWDSASCENALSVVDSGDSDGNYSLKADSSSKDYCCKQDAYGYHCYNLYVVNNFPEPKRSWGGQIYINMKNVDFSYSDVNGLAVLGAYNSNISGNRDFSILARERVDGSGNLCFSYFWPWMGSAATCGPDQNVDVPEAIWNSSWIKIEWWFSNKSNLYVKVQNTSWNESWYAVPIENPVSSSEYVEYCSVETGCARLGYFCDNGICKTNFADVRVGWVSSYLNGSVMIKDVNFYDGSLVPDILF